ncbi:MULTISPECIES: hypothetical protein [unclassified Ruegeria]|uniref:hypothetical protein n=1 Tax=unclassified Ruegeria TaxID=2625375 RepID=UPI001487EB38|nr:MULTISPECIES: hypothetical protein [unclassified Ruegeria]NOD63911.1 hypothetical protein [Ruegeria sp. HKCCD6109]NOD76265.1 hypothetical protein [Ruegeria sp. HKCCD4332]NOD90222.1 hypothetical protein [Ruegeria sp. HKCCD4318]NOD94344.1 hypothetical protein [Ruegeria sp. HKCCD4884]NOE15295.1 hypothetical protein [Ruegeria sp. HKCCD4318-2]
MAQHTRQSALNGPSNDYHLLPVTDRQMRYARAIAEKSALEIPVEAQRDRKLLSDWISTHKPRSTSQFDNYPTGKQVAFAERISRSKRRPIPSECFRDKKMMSRWIDHNK